MEELVNKNWWEIWNDDIHVVYNSITDWNKKAVYLKEIAEEKGCLAICTFFSTQIILGKQEIGDNDDIMNLQNFFVFSDYLLNKNEMCNLNYLIICNNSSDAYRVANFLFSRTIINNINITIAEVDDINKCVKFNSAKNIDKCIFNKSKFKDKNFKFPILSTSKIGALLPLIKVSNDRNNDCVPFSIINSHSDLILNAMKNDTIEEMDVNFLSKNFQLDILISAGMNQLKKMFSLINTKKSNNDTENLKELYGYIKEKLESMPLLTQIIWLYNLRYEIEQKEIVEDNKIHYNLLNKSVWDTIAYGEGILQLLENSCQHTYLKCGYFSLIVYDVNLNHVGKIAEAGRKRERIFRKYRKTTAEQFIELSLNYYFDIQVVDGAYDYDFKPLGIFNTQQNKYIDNLMDLFQGKLQDTNEKIIFHYGLPLFCRSIILNGGRFICTTPSQIIDGKNNVKQYKTLVTSLIEMTKDTSENEEYVNFPITAYNILLPLTYKNKFNQNYEITKECELFDSNLLSEKSTPQQYQIELINIETPEFINVLKEYNEDLTQVKKIKAVDILTKIINEKLEILNDRNAVFKIKINKNIEIVSKAIFNYSANNMQKKYFKLCFENNESLCEFLRCSSIFYNNDGLNNWVKNTQFALCAPSEDKLISEETKLILAGNSIESAYATVRNFAYYNSEGSLPLLTQIKYLTNISDNLVEYDPIPLFPFDLVKEAKGECEFLTRIKKVLNSNLREEGVGCKIDNIHIRIGSKIHLDDFYVATTIFDNIGTVSRFAYLIAEGIITKWSQLKESNDTPKELIIIGYDHYSSIMMMQLEKLLRGKLEDCLIHVFQYIKDDYDNEILEFVNHDKGVHNFNNAAFVFILPIGTTLSTLYKIKNAVKRKWGVNNLNIFQCYALIVVADINDKLSKNFWSKKSTENQLFDNINLTQERNFILPEESDFKQIGENNDKNILVAKNFIKLITKWHLPSNCIRGDINDKTIEKSLFEKPLVQVDKTSTSPSVIYPLNMKGIRGISFSTNQYSESLLRNLEGTTAYGHIVKENNHYQYYINYNEFYCKCKSQSELEFEGWFKEQRKLIDIDAYNIIISPINYDQPNFLKDVVDKIFLNSLHFIHIPIQKVYKEDIRSKFSHITNEYMRIRQMNEELKINVYYVDYTIVSGQSLRRGQTLIQMLLKDLNTLKSQNVKIYKKIFLLLNRSSYDTIASIVENPETDLAALVTLNIPSFNTLQDSCPICEQDKLYIEISKSSATNELYWYFQNLAIKHKRRDYEDYILWQKAQFGELGSNLRLLCRYMWINYDEIKENLDLKDFSERIYKYFSLNKITTFNEEHINELKKLKLKDLYSNEELKNLGFEKCLENAIFEKNHLRMMCTHYIMELHDKIALEGISYSTHMEERSYKNKVDRWNENTKIICNKILELWVNKIFNNQNINCEEKERFKQREILISFIKVCSRGYVCKLAPMRDAIYNIMIDMLNIILANGILNENLYKKYNKDNLKIFNLLKVDKNEIALVYVQQYQIYLTLAKRLSDLQSIYLFKIDNFIEINNFIGRIYDEYMNALNKELQTDESKKMCFWLPYVFSSKERLSLDYIRFLKWGTMSSPEDNTAFLLQELSNGLSNLENKRMDSNLKYEILDPNKISKTIILENTRLLYSGIKKIGETCKGEMTWENAKGEVDKIYKSCISDSPYDSHFEGLLPQNTMSDFFRFIGHRSNEPLNEIHKEQIAGMLLFYDKIQYVQGDATLTNKTYLKDYNDLCLNMKRIINADGCYLIHLRNNNYHIIASSQDSNDNHNENDVESIIDNAEPKVSEFSISLDSTVSYNREKKALILALQIKRRQEEDYYQKVYILLKFNNDKDISSDIENLSSKILFIRQPLQKLLERDIYALHHFQIGYEDVERIGESKLTRIMHLTDLHISNLNYDDILAHIEALSEKQIDLVVITGDIVQGHDTAIDLEENYRLAEKVLFALAKNLWTSTVNGESNLRWDWKKRIVIIPGNHDYASMNELSAVHFSRSTSSGIPTLNDGSPTVKFAYYIDFIQRFYNIDTSELVANNLNEYRVYPKLGLEIICLNTIAEVSAMRNNKMQLDKQYINNISNKLSNKKECDRFKLIIGHHTFLYNNDYIADQYYDKGVNETMIKKFKELMNYYWEWRNKDNDSEENLVSFFNDKHTKIIENTMKKEIWKTNLYSDYTYIKLHWRELTNERCQKIFMDYIKCSSMTDLDHEIYKERLSKLSSTYHPNLMLGGHRHKKYYNKEKTCFECPKFLEGEDKGTESFGILEINFDKNKNGMNKDSEGYAYTYTYNNEESKIICETPNEFDGWENGQFKYYDKMNTKKINKSNNKMSPVKRTPEKTDQGKKIEQ